MKKIISLVLLIIIIIGLAGCIIGLTNKEDKKESSKEPINSSSSYEEESSDNSSTETPSDSSSTLPEDSSSSGEEDEDITINYIIVYSGTEYPMTTEKGTTWATADYGVAIPPMTNEDIWGMYYLESDNKVWRLQNSDTTYAFLEDEITKDEIYTVLNISCGPFALQYIDGTQATMGYFEPGMTWANWVESCHNDNGYYFDSTGLTKDGSIYIISDTSGSLVKQAEELNFALYYEVEKKISFEVHWPNEVKTHIVDVGTTWGEFIVKNDLPIELTVEDNYIYYIENEEQRYLCDDETCIAIKADDAIIPHSENSTKGIYYFTSTPYCTATIIDNDTEELLYTIKFTKGMTWGEWIENSYFNKIGAQLLSASGDLKVISLSSGGWLKDLDGSDTTAYEEMILDGVYYLQ